jgi:DNA-binding SARP family transcriptional activator
MARIEIRFFSGEVDVRGSSIRLPAKEMELLFTVAAAGKINGEQLMDMLWPESDGDAAHNAFRVCLYRLRRRIADGAVIRRTGKAYELERDIAVDLDRLRDAATHEEAVTQIRAGASARAALGTWFEPFERLLWAFAERRHNGRAGDLVTAR